MTSAPMSPSARSRAEQESEAGRVARDVLLGLMKTCAKLGISFFAYLGDRLGVPDAATVPPLAQLVRASAPA